MFAGRVAASYVDTFHPLLTSGVAGTAALRTLPSRDPARVYFTHAYRFSSASTFLAEGLGEPPLRAVHHVI